MQLSVIGILGSLLIGALVAMAGGQGGMTLDGWPIFGLLVALAFLVQYVVFIPSYLHRTEHYYDLTGGLTYCGVTALALILGGKLDARSVVLATAVLIWALRLALFLFIRVRQQGADERFSELKQSFLQFLMAWSMQGLWITMTAGAALAALTSVHTAPLGIIGWVGIAIWLFGFLFEIVADEQKRQHRKDPKMKGKFIRTGLWGYTRHPNYFGEIVLWVGVALIAYPVLHGWQLVTLSSPLFVYLLLTQISGIPILERRADERWERDADYQQYKAVTPVLWPNLGIALKDKV